MKIFKRYLLNVVLWQRARQVLENIKRQHILDAEDVAGTHTMNQKECVPHVAMEDSGKLGVIIGRQKMSEGTGKNEKT